VLELITRPPTSGPLRTSPSMPVRLVLEVVNRSGRHQVALLDAHGPGRRAVHFPVNRVRLRAFEALGIEVELVPDQRVRPDIYITQLRVRPEGGAAPVSVPLRFTVLTDPDLVTEARLAPDDDGVAEVGILNTGNTDLELDVAASADGRPVPVEPSELSLPVGAEELLRVRLRRSLFSARRARFNLTFGDRSGMRVHEDFAVTVPAVFWTGGAGRE
jgi:hypothetical protein